MQPKRMKDEKKILSSQTTNYAENGAAEWEGAR